MKEHTGWGNLPGLNHSKLGRKKEKHFNISDLCYARIASIMFFSSLNATDCRKPSFPMHWKSPQHLQIQGGLWRFENISDLQCPEFRFPYPARTTALLLLHRFLIKSILNSQLIFFFFPVSNYLILYCCVYRHLNPCRETELQRIPHGSTTMACSGITSEQYWLTKQHSLYTEGFQSSTEEQLCLFSVKITVVWLTFLHSLETINPQIQPILPDTWLWQGPRNVEDFYQYEDEHKSASLSCTKLTARQWSKREWTNLPDQKQLHSEYLHEGWLGRQAQSTVNEVCKQDTP